MQTVFHWQKVNIECLLHAQSADIALRVDPVGNKGDSAPATR